MREEVPRIAVIGGGFSGAVFALRLARHAPVPVDITVVEPRENLGAGVAYGTLDPSHRINVPAARMVVSAEDPTHFDRWLRETGALEADAVCDDGHAYPQRGVFARYLAEAISKQSATRPDTPIRHRRAKAISIDRSGDVYSVTLDDGTSFVADLVVLATSHPPPTVPAIIKQGLGDDPAVIADPWAPHALDQIDPDEAVLVVGTGLTMADVVASLERRGHRGAITAFSRRGLISRGHVFSVDAFTGITDHETPKTALSLLRTIRTSIATAGTRGIPWQAVIDDVRANGQRIWAGLDDRERHRLLRHLRPFWDVHRYRVAPQASTALQRLTSAGSLRVVAASLRSISRQGDKIDCVLHPRFTAAPVMERVRVDRVVVTTGPSHGTVIDGNPALASLARHGLLHADCFGLGIAVDAASQVLDQNMHANPTLLVAGPLARAQFGELMGLPQVSAHASKVAESVALWLKKRH